MQGEEFNSPNFETTVMKEWSKKLAHQYAIKNHLFNKVLFRNVVDSDANEESFREPLRELFCNNCADIKLVLY